jgi:tripartite-type tricarboxylate transporter receptor subunit TctC
MAAAVPLVKDGRLKALAVSSKARAAPLPDVPTMAEAGLPGGEYMFWIGLFAPRNTPRPIVEKLNAETLKAITLPEVRERFRGMGAEPFPIKPADLDAFLAADTEKMGRVVKAANIKPQ